MASKPKNRSGEYYVNEAEKAGLRTRHGRGDHVIIYGKAGRGYQVVPLHRELSPGVERAIIKWFARLGIIISVVLLLIHVVK